MMASKINERRRSKQCVTFMNFGAGYCHYGIKCRYSHDLNSVPVVADDVQSHVPSTSDSSDEEIDEKSYLFYRNAVVMHSEENPHVSSKTHSAHEHCDPNNNIVKEDKSASSVALIECGICLEEYNGIRRPRTLPCAHSFCGSCLQNCICLGETKCSVCRSAYTAVTEYDLPINTDYEKFIEMFKRVEKVITDKEINKKCSEEYFSKPLLKVSSWLSATGVQPIVYLGLHAHGKALGRIRIQLTCGPKRQEQMLRLCTAQCGATWKGTGFDWACLVGKAGELVCSMPYLTPTGNRCSSAIVKDLEEDEWKQCVEGAVSGLSNDARFVICTRTKPSYDIKRPKLGHVVSGLHILRQALRRTAMPHGHSTYDAQWIRIAEAGAEIAAK